MEYTKELIRFCSELSITELPDEVKQKAKLCLLDYVANVYGSLELEAVQSVVEFVRSLGGPEAATVLGCGFRTGLQNTAFINGTSGEAMEAQDGYRFGGSHAGVAVLPAAIAVAEALDLSGARLLEAVVAGYEVANRVAASVHPLLSLSGFVPTGTTGTFGAAVAVSKLMGHGFSEMINAMGNAGYILPISMAEHLMAGDTIKIVQGGQAASAGIMAAGLAGKGITGCQQVLEGSELNGGFTRITINGEANLEKITERLGEHYSIMDVYFKPYTACRHTHGVAQATLALAKEQKIMPLEIDSINVFTYEIARIVVGKSIQNQGSFVSAQLSMPYVVAVCILDGEFGPAQITEKRIADPDVTALNKKVTVQTDDGLNGMYPDKTASRIEITMKNGDVLTKQVDIPKGDPRDPMVEQDVAKKVKLFSGSRDKKNTERIIDAIMHVDELQSIREVVSWI